MIKDNETGITIFESAAILLYLAEKTGKFISKKPKEHWQTMQWLMFNSATLAPLLGQRVNYELFEEEKIKPVIKRYQALTNEAFLTMDNHLSNHEYFAGDDYSIADIAAFGWLHICQICEFSFKQHTSLWQWYNKITLRKAVQKGISIPNIATGP